MFYSEVILARKGPLGKIWLAAHFDKKLTKKQIFSTDISSSVESVLNPANPLALRVSGHLMLGIVRIYSRKMKYLVTDCADAMWKIDLAFRPKNVDIDPTIAQIIDDARHFGNVSIDNEFPELENTAFPQDLLTGYDYPRLDIGRFSDSSFGQDGGFNDYSMSAESPLYTRKSGPTGSSTRRSVAGDIENTRFVSSQEQPGRTSLSSAGRMRPSYGSSIGAGLEDEVPAFVEDYSGGDYGGDYGGYGGVSPVLHRGSGGLGGQLLEFGGTQDQFMEEPPPFDNDYCPEEEVKTAGEGGEERASEAGGSKARPGRESLRVQQQQARAVAVLHQQEDEDGAESDDGDDEGQNGDKEAEKMGGGQSTSQGKRKKKKRVMIDDRVELPSRLIKQRRTDLAPILRQRGTDALQQQADSDSYAATRAQRNHLLRTSPLGHRAHLPAGVRGMCAELQEVFGMSINAAPLPFPLKEGALASSQPQVERSTPRVDIELELTRAPRHSELSVAGRTSLMSSQGLDVLSASKSANASFADGAATEGGNTYDAPDFGDYGGGGGYEELHDSGGDHGLELMDFGGDTSYDAGVEEGKRGELAQKRPASVIGRQPSRLAQPRNAVSELVTSTFMKGGSELDSRSAGEVSGGSKSTNGTSSSTSRHTRTEQFMGILEDEFRSAEHSVVSFDALSAGVSKRVAAACFLEVLQLKTWGRIRATQEEPFDDILLRPAPAPAVSSRLMAGSL